MLKEGAQEGLLMRGCSRGGAQRDSGGGTEEGVLRRGFSSEQASRQSVRQLSRQASRQAPGRHSVGAMPWRGLLNLKH